MRRPSVLVILLLLSGPIHATTYEQLRVCSSKPTDEEKLACFDQLTKAAMPVAPGSGKPVPPAKLSRYVVHGVLGPAFYDSGVDAFKTPATISFSRADNRNSTDVSAAFIYHRYFGEYENQGFYAGAGWFRNELGSKRSDARSIVIGAQLSPQRADDAVISDGGSAWYSIYTPSFMHRRDIYKRESTDRYSLSGTWGRFYPFGSSSDQRNTFSVLSMIESNHVTHDAGAKRDSLSATVGLKFTYGLTESLLLTASPNFYDFIDRPTRSDEGSGTFGEVSLRWDLDPSKSTRFRPYVSLSRYFGTKPEDGTWIPNQTRLAFGINFDSADQR